MGNFKSVVVSDGVRISYQISEPKGSKANIILVHGLGGEAAAWNDTAGRLNSEGYTTIAIDLRGHGGSADLSVRADYSFTRLANDVREVIEKENLDNNILVGHCYGGMVALVFAGLYGELLRGLVLVDTSDKSPLKNLTRVNIDFLIKVLKSVVGQSPDGDWSARRLMDDIRRTTLFNYLRSFQKALTYNAENVLSKISTPTLIIHGDEDSVIPMETADLMHQKISGSELEKIKGANHIVVLNNPDKLSDAIVTFVKGLT